MNRKWVWLYSIMTTEQNPSDTWLANHAGDEIIEIVPKADLDAALAEARGQAIQDFIHGRIKLCLVCGAKEPCELKHDPHSPCTFEPTPMELMEEVKQTRNAILSFGLEVMASCPEYTEAFKIGGIMAVLQNLVKNEKSILAKAIKFAHVAARAGIYPSTRELAEAFLNQHQKGASHASLSHD